MATHSSILSWRIPRTEEPGQLVHGGHRVRHDKQLNMHAIMAILSSKRRIAMQICLFLVCRPGYVTKMKEEHGYWSGNYLSL